MRDDNGPTTSTGAGSALGRKPVVALLAAAVFAISWVTLDHGFYAHGRISDVGVYQGYGLDVRLAQAPYRDFKVEYPPGALPVFIAPTYAGHPTDPVDYGRWFSRLMAVCGLVGLGFVLSSRASRMAIAYVAVSPLIVGSLMETRFDLWPMVFVTAAVAAFVRDRHRLGWLALGWAFAAKLFGVVLVPLAIVWTLKRRGREELARGIAIWLTAVIAVFLPFAIIAPRGLWDSIWGQLSRALQIESLPASVLTTFSHPALKLDENAVAIAGDRPLQLVTTALQLAVLIGLWIAFARGPAEEERLLRYVAASMCAFVVFGKVLSPQYLIWLVPLVPLVRGRRGCAAAVLLTAAAIETQWWFVRHRYGLYETEFRYAWLVLLRNLLLVATLAVLALPATRCRTESG
ncbi:MAG TPA: hypothetical protein VGM80_10805 [Gaiellaceae bacterium]